MRAITADTSSPAWTTTVSVAGRTERVHETHDGEVVQNLLDNDQYNLDNATALSASTTTLVNDTRAMIPAAVGTQTLNIPLGLFTYDPTYWVVVPTRSTTEAIQQQGGASQSELRAEITSLLPMSGTITGVSVRLFGETGHANLPQYQPRVQVVSTLLSDTTTYVVPSVLLEAQDAQGTIGEYLAAHEMAETDGESVINRATSRYYVYIRGEFGEMANGDCIIYRVQLTIEGNWATP